MCQAMSLLPSEHSLVVKDISIHSRDQLIFFGKVALVNMYSAAMYRISNQKQLLITDT